MTEQEQYIQRIKQLEFQLQEQWAQYSTLYNQSKKLIDAAIDYSNNKNPSLKKQKFVILKNHEKQLKELFYPPLKQSSQAKLEWLAQ